MVKQRAGLPSTWICSFTSCLNPYLSPKLTPKSLRLKVADASAPQTSFLDIGFGLQRKELIVNVSGLVTPCMVRVPWASAGEAPLNLVNLPVNVAVGNFATSKISADFACSFNFGMPKSTELIFTVTSMEPDFASLSYTTLPELLSNLPRHTDRPPMWSASKLG